MVFSARVQAILVRSSAAGLPARIYLPIVVIFAIVFLAVIVYLLRVAFGSTGSALGPSAGTAVQRSGRIAPPQNIEVGGGPPPAVAIKLSELRARIASHPRDDVALVELGDLYLTVGKFGQAIPLYERALRANPGNPAAKSGLEEARTEATNQPK
ncbi:MAG: tetratricopeptide repeat protein [Candidatus Eremiobacteraeota bacterium]|nr:tetratricopeptide repeat protein [Candidatus Eremiobacteraeota bacterium]